MYVLTYVYQWTKQLVVAMHSLSVNVYEFEKSAFCYIADQPSYSHDLVSAFIINSLESIIANLASSHISVFYLVSVAEQTALSLALLN